MPGSAIAVLIAVERRREGEVSVLAFGERGALVDGGADEGVTEVKVAVARAHEAG